MMTMSIDELRGMYPELSAKLKRCGIYDSEQLLGAAQAPAGRKDLAAYAGVTSRAILELANRADLARVRGVGGVFSDLLEHAGVDTAKELAARNPDRLHAKIVEVNAEHQLARRTPSRPVVMSWVAQAKKLPSILQY
jgi:nucleotidyltransferase/DNA polymerase involved in DNA repair